jgi:GPH family glycoside/pentoside/hexuronide:cation symporter
VEPSPLAGKTAAEISALYAEQFQRGLYGLCFSAYTQDQGAGDQLTEAQVRRRIALIAPHTRWVRSFACTEGHELIPRLAREKGLKTMVGAWISHDRDRNEREIAGLLTWPRPGWSTPPWWATRCCCASELTEAELLAYIARVRAALPKTCPWAVSTPTYHFLERPALTAACDVLLPNCYPFWEGAHRPGRAVPARMHGLVQAAGGDKPVIVTETGWPGSGQPVAGAVPSAEHAMRYFIDVQQWARREGVQLFYFSSFDEPWKLASRKAKWARSGACGTRTSGPSTAALRPEHP